MTASPHAPSPEKNRPLWAINSLSRCGDACGSLPSTPHVPRSCTNSRKQLHAGQQRVNGWCLPPRDKAKLHQSVWTHTQALLTTTTGRARRKRSVRLQTACLHAQKTGRRGLENAEPFKEGQALQSAGFPVGRNQSEWHTRVFDKQKNSSTYRGLKVLSKPVCLLLIGASQPQGWAPRGGQLNAESSQEPSSSASKRSTG